MFGDEDLNNKVNFVIAIVVGALIISVIFNLHYYVNLRVENENVLHNMRARALWTYGAEVGMVAHYLEEYLQTQDYDIYKEATWAIYRAKMQGDILTQRTNEESELMYHELKRTAWTLEGYFVHNHYGPINTTEVETIIHSLRAISNAITSDFDLLRNEDPLEHLEEYSRLGIGPGVDEVINYCQQIQEIVH